MKKANARTDIARNTNTLPVFKRNHGPDFFSNSSTLIQRRLSIGNKDDVYEKEADSMADKVINRISDPGKSISKEINHSTNSVSIPVQNKCTHCEQKEIENSQKEETLPETIQRKSIFESNDEPEDEKVKRKEDSDIQPQLTPAAENGLSNSKGGGSPLPKDINREMSEAFGTDLSQVRIHTGNEASRMSRDLNAQAFTHGNDIYFNQGKYAPADHAGQKLLAHELTHTIQQSGKSSEAKSTQRKEITNKTSADIVQKNGNPPATPTAPGPLPEGYKWKPNDPVEKLELPKISLPAFKSRNDELYKKTPLYFQAGRVGTKQEEKWVAEVKGDVDKATTEFVKKNEGKVGEVYFFKSRKSEFFIFDTADKLKKKFALPTWDRQGGSTIHQIDHIVEMQVGGPDLPENYELLQGTANTTVGSILQKEVSRRIKEGLQVIKDANYTNLPKVSDFTRIPGSFSIVRFKNIDGYNLSLSKGDGSLYWSMKEIKAGSHLNHLRVMTMDEVLALKGTDKKLLLFVKADEGTPHEIQLPASKKDNWIEGINLVSVNLTNPKATDGTQMGTIVIELQPDLAKKFDGNGNITLGFKKVPGLINAGSLDFGGGAEKFSGIFKVPGLSPIKVTNFDMTDKGLQVNGVITAEIPVIQGASIDFSVDGKELRLSKTFRFDELDGKLPAPFKLTDVSLTIYAGTHHGFGVEGNVDFEIKNIGKGSLTGIGETTDGFGIKGLFNVDSERFKGSKLEFSYIKKEWKASGTLKISKMPGLKDTSLNVEYENKTVKATGNTNLDIPKLDKSKFELTALIKGTGDFSVTGKAVLNGVPGVKSGTVNVTVDKVADEYQLVLGGEGEPDLPKMPKELSAKLSFLYDSKSDVFTAAGKFKYKKGRIDVDTTIGVTNSDVEDGKLSNKKGAKWVFYGTGTIKVIFIEDKATGEFTATIRPGGEFFVSGKADLLPTELMKPFDEKKVAEFPSLRIPVVGVPFISIFVEIGGGVKFYFNWQPLTISGDITLPDTDITKLSTAKLGININASSKATAGVGMQIKAKIGAEAAVIEFSGGVEGFAGLELRGSIGAGLKMELDLEKGLKPKELDAEIKVAPVAVFTLTGVIGVYLNLFISKVQIWEWKKKLAEGSLDLSDLGGFEIKVPVKFDDKGNVKPLNLDDIQVKKPEFSAQKGRDLMENIFNDKQEKKPDKEAEIKEKIRVEIRNDLRSRLDPNASHDLQKHVMDLVTKYTNEYNEKLAGYVKGIIHDEMKNIANDIFDSLKNNLRSSKQPKLIKLAEIDEYERQWDPYYDKTLTPILREEINNQPDNPVQKKEEGVPEVKNIQRSPEDVIQRVPQAGYQLPSTPRMKRWYDYKDEVVNINKPTFIPGRGLGNYIAALWENGQDAPVNVKFGTIADGFIYVKPSSAPYFSSVCVQGPVEKLLGVSICADIPPASHNYNAVSQVIPLHHSAFLNSSKGSPVLVVKITNGFISGKLGWVDGKKPDEIDPLVDAPSVQTDEKVFLPMILGEDYDGTNYVSVDHTNDILSGSLFYHSIGILKLANEQQIQIRFQIQDAAHSFKAELIGQPKGLNEYKAPVLRDSGGLLTAETANLELDANWTSGKPDDEDGEFVAKQFRLSYRNGILEIYGKANYTSPRISGEVNIAVTQLSKSKELFETHAPGEKIKGSVGLNPDTGKDSTEEPLALTAWGNLSFNLIDVDESKALAGGGKTGLEDLKGEGAFVVSHDGYIILSGKLKFPTKWKLTGPLKYNSADATGDDKHFFEHKVDVAEAPVPYGTVALKIGITVDADAALDPLELYEIEVSGVYSNHPLYRSEVNLTPRFYISGNAGATVMVSAEGGYKLGGIFKLGGISGNITGTARVNAFIDAAPSVKKIWENPEKPAVYGISGIIHTGGQLTFTLSGTISVNVLKAKILKTEDYTIGSWTLGGFGVVLELKDYIIGSGNYPYIDYKKMGFSNRQRGQLGDAIAKEKEASGTPDKRTGGLKQEEGGKTIETGTFSTTPPERPDHNKDPLDTDIEEDFLMLDKLHELIITIGGTREAPVVKLEMSSGGKKPLEEKIAAEKDTIAVEKMLADPLEDKQLDSQLADLNSIETEAKAVEKNAKGAAVKMEKEAEPVIAGYDQLDDRISAYGNKYKKNDLGLNATPKTIQTVPVTPSTLRVPKSNGASSKMEQILMEKRMEVGAATFEDFKGSNVAVFRYYVLKPTSNQIDAGADGPFYDWAENVSKGLHSEQIIAGQLQNFQSSRAFRKKYGPDYKVAVDQILTERSPCGMCSNFLNRNKSTLIIVTNYHTYYLVHYSGSWIKRNRALMIKYGLQPPSLDELHKIYGGRDLDPH